ncbi:MAG: hypothetical protein KGM97_09925, partial [Alphaproteobacteria bacterium]|nr:hypothetical protein [Alphaproteobacteria bacterium]
MELPDRGKTRSALTLQRTIGAGTIGASALVGATTFVESTAVSELWAGGVGALLALLLFFVGELLLHADPHNGLVIRAVSFIQTAAAAMLSALGTKLALVLFVVGAVVIIFLALYFAVSPATNNGGNPHALSTALEQPLNCEQEDPVITIPSLDYLQSIPPSKARDTLSATSRQFQHYRQFLNCLNEQI